MPSPAPYLMPGDRLSSVEEQVERVLAALAPLPPYDQPLLESLGLPLCEDVTAPVDLPGFDNSAMDGYAVTVADTATASVDAPVHLPVVGELAAGTSSHLALSPGTTVKIMTGAPVPQGCDAVVPVEWTDRGATTVRITRAPAPGQHLRYRGEDVRTGDVVLRDGDVIGPRQLGLLASVGRASVRARPRPRVVVMSTGAELREPGSPLGYDSVYDANSYLVAASVRACGALAYRVGISSDDPAAFADALSDQLVRADVVVTSGGVSKGEYDVVKAALSGLGTVSFGEVAMQPGKPQGFGFVGEDAVPLFALPGNPVSAYVSFEVFVVPALRRLMGRTPYRRPTVAARLTEAIRSIPGRAQFVRARFDDSAGEVTPVGGHGSHLVGDLAAANALVVVAAETGSVAVDEQVDVLVLDRDF